MIDTVEKIKLKYEHLRSYLDEKVLRLWANDPADGNGHRCSYSYMVNTFEWSNSAFWE